MAKKAVQDLDVVPIPEAQEQPKKEKRAITDKQRENLKKGMEALKAKRNALRGEQEVESTESISDAPSSPPTPKPSAQAQAKSKPSVEWHKNSQVPAQMRERIVERIVEKPVDRIVEKIVDRPVDRIVEKIVDRPIDRIVSGSALLDALFFNKK
jgi:hypothetical protein